MEVRYYASSSGRKPVKEFILTLHPELAAKVFSAITLLADGEILQMPLSKSLANVHRGLHELRFSDFVGNFRIIYYYKVGDAIYLIHGFKKKTQKTPQRELRVALKRLKEI